MANTPSRLLLALVQAPDHVCYRYRVEAFAPVLAARGWRVEPLVVPRGTWAALQVRPRIAAADVVLLQRRLFSWWHLGLVRGAARVLLFDFDDAVYCRDSSSRKPAQSWRRRRRFRAAVRMSDAITAGNQHLLEQSLSVGGTGKTHYFPTCVSLDNYRPAEHHRQGAAARLVWIGTRSTIPSLHDAQQHLAEANRRLPGIELRVVSSVCPKLSGVRTVSCPWSTATEAEQLCAGDIGVSWLPDHPWSLGKCGLKVLQYMAAGLPVVANPLGIHRELVRHGETGFLVSTPQEWAEAIARLAASPALRTQMGQAARAQLAQHYSVARWEDWLAGFIDEIAPA